MAVITIDGYKENMRGLNSVLNNKKEKQHMALGKVSKKMNCSLIWKELKGFGVFVSVDLSEISFPRALNHLEEVRFSQSS